MRRDGPWFEEEIKMYYAEEKKKLQEDRDKIKEIENACLIF